MKTKIITLKDIELSKRIADECIIQASKFGITVEEFNAINGAFYKKHLDKLKIFPIKKMRLGAYGCLLSHFYIWKQCVEDQEPYIVLEHDGFFIDHLPDNILDQFDDLLKLDNLNPYSSYYEDEINEKSTLPLEVIDLNNNPEFYSVAGLYSRGSYAYIIKPHAASALISWIEKNGFYRSDHQLGNNICRIQTVNKSVVRLHPFYLNRVKSLSLTNFLEDANGKS